MPPTHVPATPRYAGESDNGILARIPSEVIERGVSHLPTPGPEFEAQPVRQIVLWNVPDLGSVRIVYELNTSDHGSSRQWRWMPVYAGRGSLVNYGLPIPEARLLASIESIGSDLEKVITLSNSVKGMLTQEMLDRNSAEDGMLVDALTVTMLIRYSRAFSPGAREYKVAHGLIEEMSPEQKQLHEYLMFVRNKHAAHSRNRFEDTEVTVALFEEENGAAQYAGIGAGHQALATVPADKLPQIHQLAEWLIQRLNTLRLAERAKLQEIVLAMGTERIQKELKPWKASIRVTADKPHKARSKP